MPELPEIETARCRLENALTGRKIIKVITDRDDHICYDRQEPKEVEKALLGATVTGSGRKGKYFWLELNRKPWLVLHFGMTGNLEIRKYSKKGELDPTAGWGGVTLWRTRNEKVPPEGKGMPRFCRLFLVTDDKTEIAITDPRRFGRIRLSEDPAGTPPISRLGFDPLFDFPSAKDLFAKLQKRRVAIKAVLLDQTVFAGVGNWIADEVLYQAELAPHRLALQLSLAEVTILRTKLLSVICTAVKLEADYDLYPKGWLFHYRWGKEKGAKDFRRRPILHETIGGRTTAWVPQVQDWRQ